MIPNSGVLVYSFMAGRWVAPVSQVGCLYNTGQPPLYLRGGIK